MTIAVTPLAGDTGQDRRGDRQRHGAFDLPGADQPLDLPRKDRPIPTPRPNLDAWKTVNAQFVLTGASTRGGKLTARFRLWDVATGEQVAGEQYQRRCRQRAPHRASDLRRGVRAGHRREGLLRQPRRVRRRERAEAEAASSASR